MVSQKQMLIGPSSNHAAIIALYEVSREFAWMRSMAQHIRVTIVLPTIEDPTTLYEDNASYIARMKE